MKRYLVYLGILIIIWQQAFGGEYADAFLELGVSSRSFAMANCLGTLDFSVTSFWSNPAGLSYVKRPQFGCMYMSVFGLANHNYLGAALPVSKTSAVSFNWIRFGVDDIPFHPDILRQVADQEARRDSIKSLSRLPFQTFQDCEDAFFISYGKYITKEIDLGWRYYKFWAEFPFGINFKLIHKKLYNLEAYGIGIDIGGRIRANGEDLFDIRGLGNLSVGLAVQNITKTTVYWNTKRQDEIKVKPIVSFSLEQPIRACDMQVNISSEKSYIYNDPLRYGAEIIFKKCITTRAGLYNSDIFFGVGINFNWMKKILSIDYAFSNHDLGASHHIGGTITF